MPDPVRIKDLSLEAASVSNIEALDYIALDSAVGGTRKIKAVRLSEALVPTGGATGQVLAKAGASDFQLQWQNTGGASAFDERDVWQFG